MIGVVLGAAYLLWLYQRVMFGNVTNPGQRVFAGFECAGICDADGTLVLLAFWIGIYPAPLFECWISRCSNL